MSLIDWQDEFEVGVPAVDHEHREMIDLINALYENVSGEASSLTISEFLGEVYAKISAHFALEERIMRERKYDQYDGHKEDHERLLDEIRDIMDSYEEQRDFRANEFGTRLRAWFTEHFKTKDARLHKYL